ncbi:MULTISPECIES: cell wall metabolism sensor histidine kinase WalK [unclassified Crossiella]|uniref:sensor histidine kinase n=1 Tax=unclassified Crossiella TaxID=2620835 RepID=UPI001FFE81B6|nr:MULTISPECIES: HAMP domain-containing sensor histidine kinase [unclassified Crossiella]MCK2245182.1 HAMP domain-containing histidine kinase [Crossiella sp. S99.2]MCK2258835.1 HAMP domain-containing histidine kinase [Crossiella sp. S99.1]
MARPGMPARVQIMGWLLAFMALVLAVVVVVVWRLLTSDVENRVNRGLEQETKEFAEFARAGRDPRPGRVITDANGLLKAHLHNNQYPEDNEVHLGLTVEDTGRVHVATYGEPPVNLAADEPLLRGIVDAPESFGSVPTAAGELRWAKVKLAAAGPHRAAFVTAFFVDRMRAGADQTIRLLLLVSVIGFLLAAGVSWVVAGRILAPIRTVRQAAAAITEHDLTRRIPVHGKDDIAALAEQFNAMLDRLDQAFRTQRQFLDDASHELRTPITIVSGHLELMGDDPRERAEVVRLCTDELDRMNRIVQDLLLLAKAERPDFLRPAPVSLPELTSDIDAKVRALAPRRWVLESMAEEEVVLDAHRVTQAVVQLAQNAVQHTAEGDEIRLGSAVHGENVSFWVTDSGPGIAAADRAAIFDRFARGSSGRSDRSGAGLGLAIVKAIAEAHHGVVRVLSEPGSGATFGVELPLVAVDGEASWGGS